MSTRSTTKNFDQLEAGDVIVDPQGRRCTVTGIGDWETFDDVWDPKKGDCVSARGRRIFYEYDSEYTGRMSAQQSVVADDPSKVTFRVEVR